MKVLFVNYSDAQGGASRAVHRLHKGLRDIGVDSNMLVQLKLTDDFTVLGPKNKYHKILGKWLASLEVLPAHYYKSRKEFLFSTAWLPTPGLVDRINTSDADIVHLHWINFGMLRPEDIARIEKPVVWTLHDMWAFTGGCHVAQECERYKDMCGNCPQLERRGDKDLSYRILKRKQRAWKDIELTIVAPSRWLTDCAKQSFLFKQQNVFTIPNSINVSLYKPVDRFFARDCWDLPRDKKIILFGALGAINDFNKGFDLLVKAARELNHLVKDEDVELVVFGSSQPEKEPDISLPVRYLGNLSDDVSLSLLYSSADVVVMPSRQENLPNVVMESLSCGTPVVGFDLGGNKDMIRHLQNGYLAKPLDSLSLAEGIRWILKHENIEMVRKESRKSVLEKYASKLIAQKYVGLYENILGRDR